MMQKIPYVTFYKNFNMASLNKAAANLFPNGEIAIEYNLNYIIFSPESFKANSRKIVRSNRSYHFKSAELQQRCAIGNMRFPIHKVAGKNKYCIKLSEGEVIGK